MDYKIKIKKTLITDNGKRFDIGDYIAFTLFNQNTKTREEYVGKIIDILNDRIIIPIITENKQFISGHYKEILLSDIEPDSCSYVSYD